MKTSNTHEQFPWVGNTPTNPEDYLEPGYYDKLLREYSFSGRSDLELLAEHLQGTPVIARLLELGCGSGRATDEIIANGGGSERLDLVDLSEAMTGHCDEKYRNLGQVKVHRSDSVDFLGGSNETYSSVVSMWNLSHSVHQHMIRDGRKAGSEHVGSAITRFIMNNLEPNGNMYLFHYDIQSPEQRLINPWRLKLWKDADPDYDASGQSPSKILLDGLMAKLGDQGYVEAKATHLAGDPIEYPTADIALETFLNFHMEGYFNRREELPDVVASLTEGFKQYTDDQGVVRIAPGAFVYEIGRTDKVAA